jgi:hypothetical protein
MKRDLNLNFNLTMMKILAGIEVRLRMRRLGTLVALMAVIAISWALIPDPAGGTTLMAVKGARVIYTSSALAFGSATLTALLFGVIGFYLVRGRMAEDIRSGTGSVIAATLVSNTLFLLSRWIGGALYLMSLILGLMTTMLLLHALRGDGPIELQVYLQTYAVVLIPMVFFSVSCAILFDSIPVLMGKAGDVIFFFVWLAQMTLMGVLNETKSPIVAPLMLLDFSGLAISIINFEHVLGTTHMSVGMSTFDAALPAITLPAALWPAQVIWMRIATALVALLPLLPAICLFHRFSPDQIKISSARQRRSPLQFINQWSRPLAKYVQPLFALGAALPGFWGQVVADIALTLTTSPAAIAMLGVSLVVSLFADPAGMLVITVALWGIFISDVSTRDYQANAEQLTGTATGGVARRYLRQFAVSSVFGLLFMGVIAVRLCYSAPILAAALVSGIFSLSALATLFGRCSRTSRMFLSVFLFGLYIALNEIKVPMIDVFGFNGVANFDTVFTQLVVASAALFVGYVINRHSVV